MHEGNRRGAAARRIVEEAAQWMLARREGLDENARAAFVVWLRRSPAHVAEYMAMLAFERDVRDAALVEPLTGAALVSLAAAEPVVVPLNNYPRVAHLAASRRRAVSGPRRRWPWLAGVATLLLALAGAWRVYAPATGTLYNAAADAARNLDLPDGSHIRLDRGSRIRVQLTADTREITVLEGTMLIDVGRASTAPLQVTVGSNMLRDIGTVFQVRTRNDGNEVTVLSGRVDVMAPRPALAASLHFPGGGRDVLAHLHGGERAILSAKGSLAMRETPADLAQDMAWLPGELEFHDMPIADVARRFNDYGLRPLLIEDDAIVSMRISGRFHGRDPAGFVAYLQTFPGVEVRKDTDGVHIMRRAGTPVRKNS
jgi:transmembrane sensor